MFKNILGGRNERNPAIRHQSPQEKETWEFTFQFSKFEKFRFIRSLNLAIRALALPEPKNPQVYVQMSTV